MTRRLLQLVTTAVAGLGLIWCGGAATSAPADTSKPPHTYDEALAHFSATDSDPVVVKRFVTPSGNIYCSLDDRQVPGGCELGTGAIHDPSYCKHAETSYVGRIEIDHGTVTAICNSDTIKQPGAKTLPYGSFAQMRGGDIQCLSESIGVTCISTNKRTGFFLHKGQFIIFRH